MRRPDEARRYVGLWQRDILRPRSAVDTEPLLEVPREAAIAFTASHQSANFLLGKFLIASAIRAAPSSFASFSAS